MTDEARIGHAFMLDANDDALDAFESAINDADGIRISSRQRGSYLIYDTTIEGDDDE